MVTMGYRVRCLLAALIALVLVMFGFAGVGNADEDSDRCWEVVVGGTSVRDGDCSSACVAPQPTVTARVLNVVEVTICEKTA